jgi:KaiC/GvpD/RAD55 family RecA-like ATPase
LSDLVLKHNINRLCIDPITVFSINIEKSSQIRESVFDFTNLLKKLDVTVILAEETTEASDEEFEKYGLNEDEAIIMVFDNNDKFLRCIGVKKLKEFLRNEPPN